MRKYLVPAGTTSGSDYNQTTASHSETLLAIKNEEEESEIKPMSYRRNQHTKMSKSISSRGLSKNKGERVKSLTNLFNEFSSIRD